jgi:hypothetical protein
MKLYEVPRKTNVKTKDGEEFFFDHVDGMYSYCLTKEKPRQVVHLPAWEEVEIISET